MTAAGRPTAFVSHSDCSRHDTGWKHPEHQGRLPALVRAVYRDMLTLHGHLLEVEARPATEADLLLAHSAAYVRRVREASALAADAGRPRFFDGEEVVSGASWEAATAAVGAAITGVDEVLAGRARNAFCAARPPGYAAFADRAAGFSLFNSVAVAARHLLRRHGVDRVLVVQWGGIAASGIATILAGEPRIRLLTVGEAAAAPATPAVNSVALPAGSDAALFAAAFEAGLATSLAGFAPDFLLLAAGFDPLATDPLGRLALAPADFHALTEHLRERAGEHCEGRLVSVLEGGYDAAATGAAVVQHLRALAGLPPA